MSFGKDLQDFIADLRRKRQALFINCVSHVETSIKVGSAVTGAPGQPVDTGNLLNSWVTEFESPQLAVIGTPVVYAPPIEDNLRGAQLRSEVGGFHSVKMTRAGWPAIVEYEAAALESGKAGISPSPRAGGRTGGARARDERGRFT